MLPTRSHALYEEKRKLTEEKCRTIVIIYDFDGTLARGNIQEDVFFKKIGVDSESFWREAHELAKTHDMDAILAYMWLTIQKAQQSKVLLTREVFSQSGQKARLFAGLDDWFKRINNYAKKHDYLVEHAIVSCGPREMILGVPIAKYFSHIFASSFAFDDQGHATWPALAINHTNKVQFLFRINKGSFELWDDTELNAFFPEEYRPIPFSRMIYIGDGETDVAAMRMLNYQGGHSVVVYDPDKSSARMQAETLLKHKRAGYIAPADYTKGQSLERICKTLIDYIALK